MTLTAAEHLTQKRRVLGSLFVDEQRDHHRDAPTPRHHFQTPIVREINPPDARRIPDTRRMA